MFGIVKGNSLVEKIGHIVAASMLSILIVAGLVACGSTDSASQPTSTTVPTLAATPMAMDTATTNTSGATSNPTAPAQPTTDTGGSATSTQGAQTGQSGTGTEVKATLREWAIDLSQAEVPAGKVRFVVTNNGRMEHNFTVTNDNGNVGNTPNFKNTDGPQTLELDLKPGTYTVICSLPGHAARGQKAQLTVK